MKKILIALALVASGCFSAEAQTVKSATCGMSQDKVCRRGPGNSVSCYKTKFAENYTVCKNDYGYFVCCETPNATNSTFPALPVAGVNGYKEPTTDYYAMNSGDDNANTDNANTTMQADMTIPQSQSYPPYSANTATSYEGYYPQNHIRVCVNSDNVAEENRAPYKGCPAPAYDGPDKNRERNVNFTNPGSSFPQPPVTGNRQ